jgi:Bacteriophage baseplate protein W
VVMKNTNSDPGRSFLGVGWAFPPGLRGDGSIAHAVYEEDIHQAIKIILFTNPGERVMRPEFGTGLSQFVFEPANTTLLSIVEMRVRESLIAWEPRIDVLEVKVELDQNERNKILIHVSYRVRATNTLENFVYPFYLMEGTSK